MTMHGEKPALPIPSPLRGADRESFAHRSVVERLPRIGRRTLHENEFTPEAESRLQALLAEIPQGDVRFLRDATAPDAADWREYVRPHRGQNWLEVPWFFAETYFYRRILEATGYFGAGTATGMDPFAPHKRQSLQSSAEGVIDLARQVASWGVAGRDREVLGRALAIALWGNQGDLSMWPEGSEETPGHEDEASAQAHVLVNDGEQVARHLLAAGQEVQRVDLLMDNAGFELVSDLALVDYLLDGGWATAIHLHLKAHPTFVSDVTSDDLQWTLDRLAQDDDAAVREWMDRLRSYVADGRLEFSQHYFWTSPLPGWQMPADLRQTLRRAQLVISKGDANYRRLLGDRHWPYTAPFEEIVSYFPAPLLALRTFKSEVAAGIPEQRLRELEEEVPDWTTSGDWGIIQFAP